MAVPDRATFLAMYDAAVKAVKDDGFASAPAAAEPVSAECAGFIKFLNGMLKGAPDFSGESTVLRGMMSSFSLMIPGDCLIPPEIKGLTRTDKVAGVPIVWHVWPGVSEDAPILIHLHGGARIAGIPGSAYAAHLSRTVRARVLSVDYTPSPEANASQQVKEILDVYAWALSSGCRAGGVPADKIAFVGESGGGSLAASVVCAIAARRLPRPAGAWLISPMSTAKELPSLTGNLPTDPFMSTWKPASWKRVYEQMQGELPATHPDVSPAEGDWYGAAPLLVSYSSTEILADDARLLIQVARNAGVSVTVDRRSALPHGWPMMLAMPEAFESLGLASWWLRQHIYGPADV